MGSVFLCRKLRHIVCLLRLFYFSKILITEINIKWSCKVGWTFSGRNRDERTSWANQWIGFSRLSVFSFLKFRYSTTTPPRIQCICWVWFHVFNAFAESDSTHSMHLLSLTPRIQCICWVWLHVFKEYAELDSVICRVRHVNCKTKFNTKNLGECAWYYYIYNDIYK